MTNPKKNKSKKKNTKRQIPKYKHKKANTKRQIQKDK